MMKLRTIEKDGVTYAEVQDGKPIYESDDGKTIAFDAPGTVATITRLNGESKTHREAKESAEKTLKAFEGITDPAAAIKALATMSNLDQKKLIDAGEVEAVKAEINKGWQSKFDAEVTARTSVEGQLYTQTIGGAFARSKFLAEKSAIPADMAQAKFGQNFKIEDGKVAAYDQAGNKVYSRAKPGEPAEFEEAIELLFDAYAHRDQIMKGNANGGAGARNTGGGGVAKTMSRAAFDALSATAKASAITVDKVTLTD